MERTQVIIDDNKRAITIRTATGTFTQSGVSKPIIDLLNNLEEENKQLKKRNKEIYDGFMATTQELTECAEGNEKLKSIIKEVREYCDNRMNYFNEMKRDYDIEEVEEEYDFECILEILDKENK